MIKKGCAAIECSTPVKSEFPDLILDSAFQRRDDIYNWRRWSGDIITGYDIPRRILQSYNVVDPQGRCVIGVNVGGCADAVALMHLNRQAIIQRERREGVGCDFLPRPASIP